MSTILKRLENVPPSVYYIPDFLTDEEEENLLKRVNAAPKPKWTHLSKRSLQNWGGLPHPKGMLAEPLPEWLKNLGKKIADMGVFGDNLPNHVLVNKYLPGQGIMPHEDGPLYYPTVSNVTLGSHGVLDIYKPLPKETNQNAENESTITQTALEERYMGSVLLERRSLFLMQDEMYTSHLHGIKEQNSDTLDNTILNLDQCRAKRSDVLERGTRISLTVRYVPKVLKTKIFLSSKRR